MNYLDGYVEEVLSEPYYDDYGSGIFRWWVKVSYIEIAIDAGTRWSHMAIYTLGISHSTHVIGTGNINRIFSNIYTTTFPRSRGKYMNGIFPSGKRCRYTNSENGNYRLK